MALIGYCGDDCKQCPRHIATQNSDQEGLEAAAILWHKVGLRDHIANPEEMICHGCAELDTCHYSDIRECAQEKKIENCGQCNQYPCEKISTVFDKTRLYAQNCRQACDSGDYEVLKRAFFDKKKRLDAIHQEATSKA
jgi:hypothetical protein